MTSGVAVFPCSSSQVRLWLLEQLDPGTSAFNIAAPLLLRRSGDGAAGRAALRDIVARHDSLRTTFTVVDGHPVQVITDEVDIELPITDLSALPAARRNTALRRLLRSEKARPFDLSRGPLVRAHMVRVGSGASVLSLVVHHLVADGWSIGILHRELLAAYAARLQHKPPALEPVPIQYADYALWQRGQSGRWAEHGHWWEEHLADAPAGLDLPGERPGAGGGAGHGARLRRALSAELVGRVQQLARSHDATLFVLALSAYATALHRWSGQSDVIIGTPVAGRTRSELEPVVGLFVNTLPIRVRAVDSDTFPTLLARVRSTVAAALGHQDVPFEDIVRRLAPQRPVTERPLFRAMFNLLEGASLPAGGLGHSEPEQPEGHAAGDARADLALYVLVRRSSIELELVYRDDLFDHPLAVRLLDEMVDILHVATERADCRLTPVGPVAPPRPAETRPAPVNPYRRWEDDGPPSTIDERFRAVAERYPDRVAVRGDETAWTYRELWERVNGVAAAVGRVEDRGERIGLLVGHDAPMVSAVLGVLAAGGAYVPLDPHAPVARLAGIVADAAIRVVLVDRSVDEPRSKLAELRPEIHWLDVTGVAPESAPPTASVCPDDAAYLLYTSGSTGEPKGVIQSHANVLHFIRVYTDALHLAPSDRLSMVAGYGCDAAVMDLFGALLNGASLHLLDVRDVAVGALPGILAERGISVWHSTPTLFRAMLAGRRPAPDLACVRLVVLGGEPASVVDVEAFRTHFPTALFVNGFGPTECTLALQFFADATTVINGVSAPIGSPVAGVDVVVEDESGRRVEPGGVGEIVLWSRHVALGYWKRPEETSRAFGDEGSESGRRSYRTGDLAHVLPDGQLVHAGRVDGQVKVRGFRVEVAEIEAALVRQPGVRAAAVAATGTRDGQLVAYVVVDDGPAPSPAALRRSLRRRLPVHMVPAEYLVVDALPRTPSGKLDRRALPHAAAIRPLAEPVDVDAEALTTTEQVVAGIWAELLDVESSTIRGQDTFSDFGGHSLLLTQVASRVRESLHVDLALRTLFENLTLSDLAAAVEKSSSVAPDDAGPIPRRTGSGPVPLSSAQARMWFLDQLTARPGVYTITARLPLDGPVTPVAVQAAIDDLVARHESLRTVFTTVDGQPRQLALPAARVALCTTDLSGLGAGVAGRAEAAIVQRQAESPFDLEQGPLVRAHMVHLGPEANTLHLAIHHIVADGWSIGLLRRDLNLLLQARMAGRPHLLEEPQIQYGDYAVWQRQRLAGSDLSGELSWWSEQLAGAPSVLDLPTDRPRPSATTFAGALVGRRLPPDVLQRVADVGRSHGATAFMTCMAAFAALLQRWSGQDDLVIGIPVAGRTRLETEQVVGLFVNSLPIRVAMAGDPTFADLLAEVRDRVSHAQDHQDLPFEEIVRHVAPQRQLGHSPLFQVMFTTFQGDDPEEGDVDQEATVPHTATAKFDMTMTVDEDVARPHVWLEYATDLFDEATARHLLRCFERLLESIGASPECRLAEICLADDADEEAVDETPTAANDVVTEADDVAVTGACGTITHGELEGAANRLAHHLRREGVTPGAVVAISLPPGPELLTAVLGVHRAGGAFMLLDVTLPEARRAALTADCGAILLLDGDALAVPGVASASSERPSGDACGDTPAYVVYTSGSTGAPKGVVVNRRSLQNHVAAVVEAYGLEPTDRVLQFASPAFDVAIEEMLPTVAAGAAVHFTPLCRGPLPFEELERVCGAGGVTVLNLPASYWHEWVATLSPDRPPPDGLRLVVVGSEPVHPDAVARWHEVVDDKVRLLVAYGTSETTITNALYEPAAHRAWAGERRMPIGYPLKGSRLLVRDAGLRPVPAAVVGELYVGGVSLATGYLGDDALTAARFVDDPVRPGQRIYRTGDLARRRLDGAVEILGRADDQIKLRGHRIEPAEVEAHLLRQPGVRAAAVAVRKDGHGRLHLAAYVVPDAGGMHAEVLHAALRSELPPYLVPSSYTPVAELPRTGGGKVDRLRLPDPLPAVSDDEHHAPVTPTEATLARIWSEVLGVEGGQVSTGANFFELGGDSILSLQLAWRIAREGMAVTLADLFEHQTVAALAAAIDGARPAAPAAATLSGPISLSPIQRWFFETGSPEPWHDNQAVIVRLARSVTVAHVDVALRALFDRHESLRTVFRQRSTGWQATVVGADEIPFAFVVHAGGTPDLDTIAEEAHTALCLERGPLFRAELVADDEDSEYPWRLLLVAHHLVVDLVSWTILLSDLGLALEQQLAGRPLTLPPPTSSFGTWVARLSEWANSTDASEDVRWWLDGPRAVAPLPVDHAKDPSGPVPSVADQRVVRVTVGAPSLARDVRIEDALIAALAAALAQWTGATTVRLDVEGHGREPLFPDVDMSRTVGWLTVTHPLTLTVDPTASMVTTLGVVQDRLRSVPRKGLAYGAVRHLRDPGDEVVRELGSLSPAEVSFNYVGRMRTGQEGGALIAAGGAPPGPMRSANAPLPYAIDVVAARDDDSVVVWISFAATVHDRSTIVALGNRFAEAIDALAGAPTVSTYPVTPTQEAMLVHTLSNEGCGAYVEHAVLDLAEDTDVASLRAAWDQCVDRHEILRTRFVPDPGGRLVQEVMDSIIVPWRSVDWSHLGSTVAEERIDGLLQEDRRQGFDPAVAPLMRMVLIRVVGGYRLIWSHHHALLDGWSASLLLAEVDRVYTALVSGAGVALPPARQFREFVEWHRRRTAAGDEAHWRQSLAGFDTPTLEGVTGAGASTEARFEALELTPCEDLRRRVEDRARAERLTLATMVTAAWAVVLSANSGQDDVVFGMTSSGRPPDLPQASDIVGLLITTHPVRVRVEPDIEVRPWLDDLAAAQATNQSHAHASLTDIASWSDVAGPRPLFESLLVFENYPARRARRRSHVDGVHAAPVRETSNFPLNVVVAADLTLKVIYDTSRFEPAWAASLLPQLLIVLDGLADDGCRRLRDVPVLTPDDRHRILEEWNDSARPVPLLTLGELWSRAADAHGHRIAIDGPDGTVTYSQLEQAVNRLAHRLLAQGVRPGDLVGVMGERSAESVVGVLAVIRVGAGYVPLDPSLPDDRLSLIAEDTKMTVALAPGHLVDRLPERLRTGDGGVVVLDPTLEHAPTASDPIPPFELSDDAVAYVMYTSGSTGRPKGVVVPHRAVTRLVVNTDYCALEPSDAVAFASNFSFDAATFEIWGALLSGSRLAIVATETLLDPVRLASELRDRSITTMFVTTALFNEVAGRVPDAFSPLRTVLFGGERADPGSVRTVLRAGPPERLLHVYGPTETTTFASWHHVTDVPEGVSNLTVGRPIANTELVVLDRHQRLVPPNVPGELCIGGLGLAHGYLGDPELTARRFVPHPHRPGGRLYRSGDLAVQRLDGTVELRGRIDAQVKIRGFRIEPGEVEAHLLAHPAVAQAAVIVRQDRPGIHELAAYAVLDGAAARAGPAELRAFLRERLPSHLVPSTVSVLGALPLTANGKVDRARLPVAVPEAAGDDRPPAGPTEVALSRIWADVLTLDEADISCGHSFFELGGHSLLLTSVASRIRDQLGAELPLRVLFDTPTLAALAAAIDACEDASTPPIPRADRSAHRATVSVHGHLRLPGALRERLRALR